MSKNLKERLARGTTAALSMEGPIEGIDDSLVDSHLADIQRLARGSHPLAGKQGSGKKGLSNRVVEEVEKVVESLNAIGPASGRAAGDSRGSGQTGGRPMRLEFVALSLIDDNPYNARQVYKADRVSELALSIKANGQEVPGIATVRNGRYLLVAGHYRKQAHLRNDSAEMMLVVMENVTDHELYEISYRENKEREAPSALDNAIAWHGLLERGLYRTAREIAAVTGMSEANVSKTLAINKLSEMVLDEVKQDPASFPFTLLSELVTYESKAGFEKALLLAQRIGRGEVSRADIIAARERLDDPVEPLKKERYRLKHKILKGGKDIGVLKEWDAGRIMLDLKVLDPALRTALVQELKKVVVEFQMSAD